jgi:hypothetical protein
MRDAERSGHIPSTTFGILRVEIPFDTDVPVERGSLSLEINRAIISRIIKQQVHEEPE